jgi:energy-coupling factor transporter transmembrane protein EcfT
MRKAYHPDQSGSGNGLFAALSPQARLLCGVLVLVTALTSLPDPLTGIIFTLCVSAVFLLLCGAPLRHLMRASIAVVSMSAPVLCYAMIARSDGPAFSPGTSLSVDAAMQQQIVVVALKGMSCALIVVGALSTVSFSELSDSLARIPLPRIVLLLILQILHQTQLLRDETARISDAFAVRGATSGIRASGLVLRYFPQTWLPRIVSKSDRVANAMELRGYGTALPQFVRSPMILRDWCALCVAALMTGVVIVNRLLGCL